jgi:Bacterial PH domain
MDAAEPARFRPTWQQAIGRGLYLGALISVVGVSAAVLTAAAVGGPPAWVWLVLTVGPPLLGALGGVPLRRRLGTEVDAGGIRTVTPFGEGVEPWSRVVDLRAERRGARTVVSVYLDSGASVQLAAPYSGELFAADPQFELKLFTLSHLWRSHRIGGVPC